MLHPTPHATSPVTSFARHHLINGQEFALGDHQYRCNIVRQSGVTLEPVAGLSHVDKKALEDFLEVLRTTVSTPLQRIADRLVDPHDGVISCGAYHLAHHIGALPKAQFDAVAPYILHLSKRATHYNPSAGHNIPPPVPRDEFERIVSIVPRQLWSFRSKELFLNAIYDATPHITEGYYLFSTPQDFERFERSLGSRYQLLKKVVANLYVKATHGALSTKDWKSFRVASRTLGELQKRKLTEVLSQDSHARQYNTRVYLSVDENGAISLKTLHYQKAFQGEWDAFASVLKKSILLLPERCSALAELLTQFVDYATAQDESPTWGESLPTWVSYTPHESILDVNFCCEETDSCLGNKATPQLVVNQQITVPKEISNVWQRVVEAGNREKIATHLFKMLHGAGSFSHFIIFGEKLPNPKSRAHYKVMTFANCITEAVFRGYLSQTSTILQKAEDEIVRDFQFCPTIGVALHEYGHTLGGRNEALGEHALSTEETNAQASVPYLAARFKIPQLSELLLFECVWMPIHRMLQGTELANSRCDLVLFDEYVRAGAVVITGTGTNARITLTDQELIFSTAFAVALKTRLWEQGIPTRLHQQFVEPFDVLDNDQDIRILSRAKAWMQANYPDDSLFTEVQQEVASYYADKKFADLANLLAPLIHQLPNTEPYSVWPSNSAIRSLISERVTN